MGLGAIGAIAGAAGSIISSSGSSGASAASAARMRELAEARREEAAAVKERTLLRVARFQREARRRRGERIAAFAGSGISLEGSAIDVLADAAMEEEIAQEIVRFEGERLEKQTRLGAEFAAGKASSLESQSRDQMIGGILSAGATLLGGFA